MENNAIARINNLQLNIENSIKGITRNTSRHSDLYEKKEEIGDSITNNVKKTLAKFDLKVDEKYIENLVESGMQESVRERFISDLKIYNNQTKRMRRGLRKALVQTSKKAIPSTKNSRKKIKNAREAIGGHFTAENLTVGNLDLSKERKSKRRIIKKERKIITQTQMNNNMGVYYNTELHGIFKNVKKYVEFCDWENITKIISPFLNEKRSRTKTLKTEIEEIEKDIRLLDQKVHIGPFKKLRSRRNDKKLKTAQLELKKLNLESKKNNYVINRLTPFEKNIDFLINKRENIRIGYENGGKEASKTYVSDLFFSKVEGTEKKSREVGIILNTLKNKEYNLKTIYKKFLEFTPSQIMKSIKPSYRLVIASTMLSDNMNYDHQTIDGENDEDIDVESYFKEESVEDRIRRLELEKFMQENLYEIWGISGEMDAKGIKSKLKKEFINRYREYEVSLSAIPEEEVKKDPQKEIEKNQIRDSMLQLKDYYEATREILGDEEIKVLYDQRLNYEEVLNQQNWEIQEKEKELERKRERVEKMRKSIVEVVDGDEKVDEEEYQRVVKEVAEDRETLENWVFDYEQKNNSYNILKQQLDELVKEKKESLREKIVTKSVDEYGDELSLLGKRSKKYKDRKYEIIEDLGNLLPPEMAEELLTNSEIFYRDTREMPGWKKALIIAGIALVAGITITGAIVYGSGDDDDDKPEFGFDDDILNKINGTIYKQLPEWEFQLKPFIKNFENAVEVNDYNEKGEDNPYFEVKNWKVYAEEEVIKNMNLTGDKSEKLVLEAVYKNGEKENITLPMIFKNIGETPFNLEQFDAQGFADLAKKYVDVFAKGEDMDGVEQVNLYLRDEKIFEVNYDGEKEFTIDRRMGYNKSIPESEETLKLEVIDTRGNIETSETIFHNEDILTTQNGTLRINDSDPNKLVIKYNLNDGGDNIPDDKEYFMRVIQNYVNVEDIPLEKENGEWKLDGSVEVDISNTSKYQRSDSPFEFRIVERDGEEEKVFDDSVDYVIGDERPKLSNLDISNNRIEFDHENYKKELIIGNGTALEVRSTYKLQEIYINLTGDGRENYNAVHLQGEEIQQSFVGDEWIATVSTKTEIPLDMASGDVNINIVAKNIYDSDGKDRIPSEVPNAPPQITIDNVKISRTNGEKVIISGSIYDPDGEDRNPEIQTVYNLNEVSELSDGIELIEVGEKTYSFVKEFDISNRPADKHDFLIKYGETEAYGEFTPDDDPAQKNTISSYCDKLNKKYIDEFEVIDGDSGITKVRGKVTFSGGLEKKWDYELSGGDVITARAEVDFSDVPRNEDIVFNNTIENEFGNKDYTPETITQINGNYQVSVVDGDNEGMRWDEVSGDKAIITRLSSEEWKELQLKDYYDDEIVPVALRNDNRVQNPNWNDINESVGVVLGAVREYYISQTASFQKYVDSMVAILKHFKYEAPENQQEWLEKTSVGVSKRTDSVYSYLLFNYDGKLLTHDATTIINYENWEGSATTITEPEEYIQKMETIYPGQGEEKFKQDLKEILSYSLGLKKSPNLQDIENTIEFETTQDAIDIMKMYRNGLEQSQYGMSNIDHIDYNLMNPAAVRKMANKPDLNDGKLYFEKDGDLNVKENEVRTRSYEPQENSYDSKEKDEVYSAPTICVGDDIRKAEIKRIEGESY